MWRVLRFWEGVADEVVPHDFEECFHESHAFRVVRELDELAVSEKLVHIRSRDLLMDSRGVDRPDHLEEAGHSDRVDAYDAVHGLAAGLREQIRRHSPDRREVR